MVNFLESFLRVAQHAEAGYHPVLPGLILLLPLVGFVINGLGAFLWRDNKRVPSVVGPLAIIGAFAVVVANFSGHAWRDAARSRGRFAVDLDGGW